jgi:hypothetical protein
MHSGPTNLRDLREWVKKRLKSSQKSGDGVNVYGRVNKAVSINVGAKGGRRRTQSKQTIRVKQSPGGTTEQAETQETRQQQD